jgi:hypothetical protein
VKPRTRNEKILLVILATILFVGGNFYAYQWISGQQNRLERSYIELKGDQAEAKVELQKADVWSQRAEWVQAHEPLLKDEAETKAQILEFALKGARDNKLEIMDQGLIEKIQRGPAGAQVGVSLKVKGSMESLARWLSSLQKPDQFYAVSAFSLNLDQDQKSFICSMQLIRYFKEGS